MLKVPDSSVITYLLSFQVKSIFAKKDMRQSSRVIVDSRLRVAVLWILPIDKISN